jgi:hypothetical protein
MSVVMHFVPTDANASRMEWMTTATVALGRDMDG